MKKILLIIFILVLILLGYFAYQNLNKSPTTPSKNSPPQLIDISKIKDIPTQTGGDVFETTPPAEQQYVDATGLIMSQLPIYTPNFTITFRYATGKFIVTRTNLNIDLSSAFQVWYSNSPYQAIPLTRFLLVP
ncbi:MAG: hypothetical protein UX38_C0001G0004 [Microgenomates group bacterium GW2011_GWC1_46_16]|nr:MAG: hypothetical protein UX38_C0001G0004 [Microgenomates group bacterium GW2011_GWC1_46_16]KKU27395.1 MAG: hypothetical protein UX40_C0018G0004 [Microgenomates group bacterium GW2011_GWF2_46_18]KKU44571.1 MAG: hypothetical protein UX63_C0032G0003 [Microgenomates group bacterium GW2011_GWB1_46_7]HBD02084.1 hypothetical protein [Candidatus Collierbacteria bacterium]HBO10855.1 hypothetical protein [Candidatus Collierbacteria bacterium]